jgi:hypothetical protein
MGTVSNIDDHIPHFVVQGLDRVHVIPVSAIKAVVSGNMKFTDFEDGNDFIPTILEEWMKNQSIG